MILNASDLSKREWARLEPLISPAKPGGHTSSLKMLFPVEGVLMLWGLPIAIAVIVPIMIVVTFAVPPRAMSIQGRKALEQRRARYTSGLALIRYIQLNRRCSEEDAYQRLATFVKKHVPSDCPGSIERMAAHNRQSLLEIAQGLVVHDPDEIDKI